MDNYILKYGNYTINEAKESIEFPLFISNKLQKILNKISTEPIAKRLLEAKNAVDVSFIDIDTSDSKSVSFFPLDRIERVGGNLEILAKYWPKNPPDDSDLWKSKYRQSQSWGKLINKLFPNEFSNMDIDRFYNRYRPEIDIKENDRFKIVHGDDIRYWYLKDRYKGSIGSCMRHSSCQTYFQIYTNNPEKCGLLIYFDDLNDKYILGRGLVWNNLIKPSGDTQENKDPYTLLDRVYFVNGRSDLTSVFNKYAIDNDWIYKNGDSFYMNGVAKTTSVSTRLKPVEYKQYPYMDTMIYYTPATGRAASTPGNPGRDPKDPSKIFQRYTLRSQHGGYENVYR